MNIFVLDNDVKLCAEYHCDKHISKMCIEHVQMLSTSLRLNGCTSDSLYKTTHQNHPCNIWTRTSRQNFLWLSELTYHLFKEYTKRYGKEHGSLRAFDECIEHIRFIPDGELTPFVFCGPDECLKDSVVDSYRDYYKTHKSKFAKWNFSTVPSWYTK